MCADGQEDGAEKTDRMDHVLLDDEAAARAPSGVEAHVSLPRRIYRDNRQGAKVAVEGL
jgi:hypothetical protein